MYRIIQIRKRPSDTKILSHVVWTGTRLKEARGQLRAQIRSLFSTLEGHNFWGSSEYFVDMENYVLTLYFFDEEPIEFRYILEEFKC